MEENTLTTREQVEQDAKNGFRQGLNCSECVLGSFKIGRASCRERVY